jgi:uncharacterized protein YfeS
MSELTVASLNDGIRDRVRLALLEAIPNEQMDALLAAEFARYFKEERWNGGSRPSPFQEAVKAEIDRQVKAVVTERIKDQLASMVSTWDEADGQHKLVGELVEKLAPLALKGFMADIVSMVASNIRSSIENARTGNRY